MLKSLGDISRDRPETLREEPEDPALTIARSPPAHENSVERDSLFTDQRDFADFSGVLTGTRCLLLARLLANKTVLDDLPAPVVRSRRPALSAQFFRSVRSHDCNRAVGRLALVAS
jgi:hypothetical protein